MDVASPPDPPARGTATSNFGVGKRESHDASSFYERFVPPILSTDDEVTAQATLDRSVPSGPNSSSRHCATSSPVSTSSGWKPARL